jgi:hypothetical protein
VVEQLEGESLRQQTRMNSMNRKDPDETKAECALAIQGIFKETFCVFLKSFDEYATKPTSHRYG